MRRIGFITTCKGRLHHLRESLPRILAQRPDEVVVVDYACPDGAGAWVEANHPGVKVVRAGHDAEFNLAHARNLGAGACSAEWLCFIDADILVEDGWVEWMRAELSPWCFYRAESSDSDLDVTGTVICSKAHFDAIEGYDEVFRNWGGEDIDLYNRLLLQRLGEARFPGRFVRSIAHDDAERFRYSALKHRGLSIVMNECYAQAKQLIMAVQGNRRELPLDVRNALMEQVRRQIVDWRADPSRPLPSVISLNVEGYSWLPEPYALRRQASLSLSVARPQPA